MNDVLCEVHSAQRSPHSINVTTQQQCGRLSLYPSMDYTIRTRLDWERIFSFFGCQMNCRVDVMQNDWHFSGRLTSPFFFFNLSVPHFSVANERVRRESNASYPNIFNWNSNCSRECALLRLQCRYCRLRGPDNMEREESVFYPSSRASEWGGNRCFISQVINWSHEINDLCLCCHRPELDCGCRWKHHFLFDGTSEEYFLRFLPKTAKSWTISTPSASNVMSTVGRGRRYRSLDLVYGICSFNRRWLRQRLNHLRQNIIRSSANIAIYDRKQCRVRF